MRENVWFPSFFSRNWTRICILLSSLFYSSGACKWRSVWFLGKCGKMYGFIHFLRNQTSVCIYSTFFPSLFKWGLLLVALCLVSEKMFGFLHFLRNQTRVDMDIFYFLPYSQLRIFSGAKHQTMFSPSHFTKLGFHSL